MRHMKIASASDIPAAAVKPMVRAAVALNRSRWSDQTLDVVLRGVSCSSVAWESPARASGCISPELARIRHPP